MNFAIPADELGNLRARLENMGAKYRGPGLVHSFEIGYAVFGEDREKQLTVYLYDSLWCACVHKDCTIAYRALKQALRYATALQETFRKSPMGWETWLWLADNRMEKIVLRAQLES